VKILFASAREHRPSIIFIDEIDALCGNRDEAGSSEHTARMKTEFLVQMDGVGKDNTGVLVLAATNLPWVLDPALRRRFQRRIHIPLPDAQARSKLFEIEAGALSYKLSDKDFKELGRQTEGLSGSDISNAVQDALMQPVTKILIATHWKTVITILSNRHWCFKNKRLMFASLDTRPRYRKADALQSIRLWSDANELAKGSPRPAL
jgi:vacuolar protein-sorting-associated protein 4